MRTTKEIVNSAIPGQAGFPPDLLDLCSAVGAMNRIIGGERHPGDDRTQKELMELTPHEIIYSTP